MKMGIKHLSLTMAVFMVVVTSSCTSLSKNKNHGLICEATKLFDNGQKEDALQLYRKALERGDIRAKLFLATCYMYGDGIEKNETKALSLYKSFSTLNSQPPDYDDIPVGIIIFGDDVVGYQGSKFEPEDKRLETVSEQLSILFEIATEHNCQLLVDIQLEPGVSHARIVSVIDACSRAGIEYPFFFSAGFPPKYVRLLPMPEIDVIAISEQIQDCINMPNQRVDPTVKTPVESGKVQGTAGHP